MSVPVLDPLASSAPLIVYLDIKSPYAYLAKDPVYALADDLDIAIDVRPLTLDIPSYLGSAKADSKGKVLESNRSPGQWNAVRYAYRDAKRYARMRDLEIKGTQKIWDTSLASIAMLWGRRQGPEVVRAFLDTVYPQFWRRELDVEDATVVVAQLRSIGADLDGFDEFLAGPGRAEHDALMATLHPAGIYGVPTFVVDGQCYFGREQLPRVKAHLEQGDPATVDIGYEAPSPAAIADQLGPTPEAAPTLYVDFKNPNAYFAVAPTRRLEAEIGRPFRWRAVDIKATKKADPAPDQSVAQRHFSTRAAYNRLELDRAATQQGLELRDVPRDLDTRMACVGLNWAEQHDCVAAYVDGIFAGIWGGTLNPGSATDVAELLDALGAPDFAGYVQTGLESQQQAQDAAQALGLIGTPTYQVGDHLFVGREHLPLLRVWLGGTRAREGS